MIRRLLPRQLLGNLSADSVFADGASFFVERSADAYIRRTFLLPNYSHPSRNFFDTYAIFYTKRAALLKVEPLVLKVESNTAKVEKKNKFNLDFLNKIR